MSAKALLSASVSAPPAVYVEDVFSTYLYTGNGSTQTITNGIDLAGEGGLVWIKNRSGTGGHRLFDTARGVYNWLASNSAGAQQDASPHGVTAFNSNGFAVSDSGPYAVNDSGATYASWTFRKAPRFFDVVTYAGNGVSGRAIPHNLGTDVGMIIVKWYDGSQNWAVWHRTLTAGKFLILNGTNAENTNSTIFTTTAPTSTEFYVGSDYASNGTGANYVAYLFAHDPLGPSGDGSDGLISCGSYTGNGSAAGPQIDLGWEPQWVLIKKSSDTENWYIYDSMRGVITGPHENGLDRKLVANSSGGESGLNFYDPINFGASGFNIGTTDNELNGSGGTYIYIAIRRGPMRAPESGTEVFAVDNGDGSSVPSFTSGFPVDFGMSRDVGVDGFHTSSRLTSGKTLDTNSTAAEGSNSNYRFDYQSGWFGSALSSNYYSWMFRRAPGFFDVVAYSGSGSSGLVVNHNLGVSPELLIFKNRGSATNWFAMTSANYGNLNTADPFGSPSFMSFSPTTFTINTTGTSSNANGQNYIAYLFASCPGVSKVGSFTHTIDVDTNVDCGFTSGARFVLIKRTNSTGDWYVFDTARGIASGSDKALFLNNTLAEQTADWLDPSSTGFIVDGPNWSSDTYIFLAIA